MDPVGPQQSKKSSTPKVLSQRKGMYDTWESNAPKDLDGGFNTKSGTRRADSPRQYDKWQGTTKGKTKHTYGVHGQNDPD